MSPSVPPAPPRALPGQRIALDPARHRLSSYPFHCTFAPRWSDMQDGFVSRNGIYHLQEDVRVALMADALGPQRFAIGAWRALLRAVTVEHLAPARFAPLQFGIGVGTIGRSSYSFAIGGFQDGRCVALCDTVGVQVDDNHKPTPIPDAVREALQTVRLLGGEAAR